MRPWGIPLLLLLVPSGLAAAGDLVLSIQSPPEPIEPIGGVGLGTIDLQVRCRAVQDSGGRVEVWPTDVPQGATIRIQPSQVPVPSSCPGDTYKARLNAEIRLTREAPAFERLEARIVAFANGTSPLSTSAPLIFFADFSGEIRIQGPSRAEGPVGSFTEILLTLENWGNAPTKVFVSTLKVPSGWEVALPSDTTVARSKGGSPENATVRLRIKPSTPSEEELLFQIEGYYYANPSLKVPPVNYTLTWVGRETSTQTPFVGVLTFVALLAVLALGGSRRRPPPSKALKILLPLLLLLPTVGAQAPVDLLTLSAPKKVGPIVPLQGYVKVPVNVTISCAVVLSNAPNNTEILLSVEQGPRWAFALLYPPRIVHTPTSCTSTEATNTSYLFLYVLPTAPAFVGEDILLNATVSKGRIPLPISASGRVNVSADYYLSLGLVPIRSSVQLTPGSSATFVLSVENKGNDDTNVELRLSKERTGFRVDLPPPRKLGSRAKETSPVESLLNVSVTAPSDSPLGSFPIRVELWASPASQKREMVEAAEATLTLIVEAPPSPTPPTVTSRGISIPEAPALLALVFAWVALRARR